jgi:hypothetical protein
LWIYLQSLVFLWIYPLPSLVLVYVWIYPLPSPMENGLMSTRGRPAAVEEQNVRQIADFQNLVRGTFVLTVGWTVEGGARIPLVLIYYKCPLVQF